MQNNIKLGLKFQTWVIHLYELQGTFKNCLFMDYLLYTMNVAQDRKATMLTKSCRLLESIVRDFSWNYDHGRIGRANLQLRIIG